METDYKVVYRIEARQSIDERADYIAEQSDSRITASRYTEKVYAFCDTLSTFPNRNIKRNDLRPGLRITHFKGTAIIAYAVDEETKTVYILDIFHSGQDYASHY